MGFEAKFLLYCKWYQCTHRVFKNKVTFELHESFSTCLLILAICHLPHRFRLKQFARLEVNRHIRLQQRQIRYAQCEHRKLMAVKLRGEWQQSRHDKMLRMAQKSPFEYPRKYTQFLGTNRNGESLFRS